MEVRFAGGSGRIERLEASTKRLPAARCQNKVNDLGLTPKQRHFVEAYIETRGNAPEAALTAYNCSSRAFARVIAHRKLHNPAVRAYLEFLLLKGDALRKLVEATGCGKARRG